MNLITNKNAIIEMELVEKIIGIAIIVVCVIGVIILMAKYGSGIDAINRLFRLR
jgi:hypothetical protein